MQGNAEDVSISCPPLPVGTFEAILQQAPYALSALWAVGTLSRLVEFERIREALHLLDSHFALAREQWRRAVADHDDLVELRLAVPRPLAMAWLLLLTKMCDLARQPEAMELVGGQRLGPDELAAAHLLLDHVRQALGRSP